jgi:nucleoside-diphosphate-sugar epimerase
MSDFWPSKRILLTGGAGFAGTALSLEEGLRRTIDRYRTKRDIAEQATF